MTNDPDTSDSLTTSSIQGQIIDYTAVANIVLDLQLIGRSDKDPLTGTDVQLSFNVIRYQAKDGADDDLYTSHAYISMI